MLPVVPLLFFLLSHYCARAFPAPSRSVPPPTLLAHKKVCVAGAGPCGLFLASLLLLREPTCEITILERAPRHDASSSLNAFGIGLGARLLNSLEAVPGLRERVEAVGAPAAVGLKIASRSDLAAEMAGFLIRMDAEKRQCQILYGEGCTNVDLDGKEVTTATGKKVQYDLLIGADGINSIVRRSLVQQKGVKEKHNLEPRQWKALRMTPQPDFAPDSFRPLRHPLLTGGHLLPRYPDGHTILAFWEEKDGARNPGGCDTPEELKAMLTEALQDDPPPKSTTRGMLWKMVGVDTKNDAAGKPRAVAFDDEAVDLFLNTRPSRSHYMKVDRFHDDSVAVVGDAAHGMNALLGQGCACGLKSAEILAECLLGSEFGTLEGALQAYSSRAVRGSHAITDLGLLAVLLRAGPVFKALMVPITLINKWRGRAIFQRMNQVDVPYERVLRENWLLIALAKLRWRWERRPFLAKEQEGTNLSCERF